MKTILRLKKQFILFFLLLVGGFSWGQTTYSSSPTVGSYTTCPTSDIKTTYCNSGNSAYYRASTTTAQLRLRVTSISGNQITFEISKCSGTAFSNGTTFYLKEETASGQSLTQIVCGNNYPSSGITITNATTKTISYTYTANFTSGTKYLMGITIASVTGDRYYTDAIGITATTVTPGSVSAMDCFITNASNFNIGDYFSGSILVYNPSLTNSWSGYVSVILNSPTTGQSYPVLSNSYYYIASNKADPINFSTNLNIPSGAYKLYCKYTNAPNGGTDYINNNNSCTINDNFLGTNTPTKLIVINQPQPNLVCGASTISPASPIKGQSANFKYTISNTGTGDYTGTLQLWIRNATTVGVPLTGQSISGLLAGKSFTFDYTTLSGITFDPGSYVLQIEDASSSPIVKCSVPFTIVAAPIPSCITWSGTPPTGEKLIAAEYLCKNNMIQSTQNGTDNATNALKKELLAKITCNGIYMGATKSSPAVNFPVPFTDMQGSSTLYIDAIKTLAYLQYNDEITPFDRDLINFNPDNYIPRKYALKTFMEAFNIPKSTATPSPFSDVATTDPMYGYIKKANELGLVLGNTVNCASGTCFHPDDYITIEDAFVILYRILTATNITRPTATQLNSLSSYFVPANRSIENMNMAPGIDQGNFDGYSKTSFHLPGRGVSLNFTHAYNSFLTELPKGYFEDDHENANSQKFIPLGRGWTHTYNMYAQKIKGYTYDTTVEPDKLMVYYPNGTINIFNYATGIAEGVGVYDKMTRTAISGGERITITAKDQVKYVFENFNNGKFYFIKSIKNRNNNGVDCTWSSYLTDVYRLTKVQENSNGTLGRYFTFNYKNLSSFISSVFDSSLNRTITFEVDVLRKNLSWFKDAKGQQTAYSYDTSGSILGTNLLTEIQLPKGNKIKNTYFQNKLKQSQVLNAANVATSTTSVNWQQNYTSAGHNSTATITDPQGLKTTITHNSLGNPSSIASPTDNVVVNSYDTGKNAHLPTSITINGQTTTMSYNSMGDLLNISKNGISNSYTYTIFNDVYTFTDGNGNTTTFHYSPIGNLERIERPQGAGNITITRDSSGQIISITNPSGITTIIGHDSNGLENEFTIPGNIKSFITYDSASRLSGGKDQNGNFTTYKHNIIDLLEDIWDAYGNNTHITYDANGNEDTTTNAKNETQTKTYGEKDELKTDTFGPHTKTYTYYADGKTKTFDNGNGTYTYTYDPVTGRLMSDGHTSYTYHPNGQIATIINTGGTLYLFYDNQDRLDYYDDYYGNRVRYTYDNNNNVKTISYPSSPFNTKVVEYFYDNINRCYKVKDWNGKETLIAYKTDDRLEKVTLPNGTFADYGYDNAGRMSSITNKKANDVVISSYGFTLDNAGNHLTETITEPSITAGLQNIANKTVTYGLYPYNRIQTKDDTNYTHNTAGAIEQAGNSVYTYDINDNMLTAPNSTFVYDGAGNRREKTVNGQTTRFVLSILGMSQVLMETNNSNAVQNYYVYGPTGLLYRIAANNNYSYYHYDYRGSTTAITNDAQTITHSYSYDPFGYLLAKTETNPNPFQYVGQHGVQYESPTLTFMRARYYDPTIGRFLSEDPIEALNLYPYAGNNPVMMIDPKGLYGIRAFMSSYSPINYTIGDTETILDLYFFDYTYNHKTKKINSNLKASIGSKKIEESTNGTVSLEGSVSIGTYDADYDVASASINLSVGPVVFEKSKSVKIERKPSYSYEKCKGILGKNSYIVGPSTVYVPCYRESKSITNPSNFILDIPASNSPSYGAGDIRILK